MIIKAKRVVNTLAQVLALAIIATLPLGIAAQSKKDRDRAKKLMTQADAAFAQKDYKLAADTYGQVVTILPNNAVAHFRKGFSHFNLKEYDPAVNELTLALNQGFRPVEVYRTRAFIYYEQKKYDAAVEDIKKGLALDPKNPAFLKGLGEVYMAKGDTAQAITALQNAEKELPSDADVHYNLARAYFTTGDVRAQATQAEAALKQGTRFVGESYFLLGDANKKLKNNTAAIDAYQKAITAKPDVYQSYRDLADIFRSENRFADAVKVSKQATLQFPSDGSLWTDLSWYYSLADRPDDAVQAAKAAIVYSPTQYAAYTNLCRAYNDTKQYDLAISACNMALKLQPGDGETYFYLGRAHNLTGKTVEATRFYGLAVTGLLDYTAKNPNYSDGWYLLGNAYFADGQRDKAIEAYLECLKLSPKFAKARYNLGIIYTRKKNRPAATEQYNALMQVDAKLAALLKTEIDQM
jgi:tetratricopeptide (TPR) repeat protein